MLVRIRCKNGNFRFQHDPNDDVSTLIEEILKANPEADPVTLALASNPPEFTLANTLSGSLASLGINHGDMLHASFQEKSSEPQLEEPTAQVTQTDVTTGNNNENQQQQPSELKPWELVQDDPVDKFWQEKDGKIVRQRDMKMCRHGDKGMCDYCMPLEPYDGSYQSENGIKHLSFNAYLRKLNAEANKPKTTRTSYIPPLTQPDYRVQVPCPSRSHPSWPQGICTKCQPSAITLQLQQFRLVDHVEFAHSGIVDQFISFWRKTGTQRFGFLLGQYKPYEQVPMGIKAVVETIHETPQAPEIDGINVEFPLDEMPKIQALAESCNLRVVGVVYTDLTHDSEGDANNEGKVLCKRHKDSYFLSSLETLFAARLQNENPNPCTFSETGTFSSKFVTCVVTGDENGDIVVNAYQVSNQAMALQQADLIEASVDPSVVRVIDEPDNDKRYTPDIFYRYTNQYKIDVKESAKPCFPVDYLVVSLTHGFPSQPSPIFRSYELIMPPFPTNNRPGIEDQTRDKLVNDLIPAYKNLEQVFNEYPVIIDKLTQKQVDDIKNINRRICDWNLLTFLTSQDFFPKDDLKAFIDVVNAPDDAARIASLQTLFNTETWHTLLALSMANEVQAEDPTPDIGGASGGGTSAQISEMGDPVSDVVTCEHCTFENPRGKSDCEMCGLPLPS